MRRRTSSRSSPGTARALQPGLTARALDLGAVAAIAPEADTEALLALIRATVNGHLHDGSPVALVNQRDRDRLLGRDLGLTRREREVLALVVACVCNVDIARRLHLTENTVKSKIRSAYAKIGATTRAQAVAWGSSTDSRPPSRATEREPPWPRSGAGRRPVRTGPMAGDLVRWEAMRADREGTVVSRGNPQSPGPRWAAPPRPSTVGDQAARERMKQDKTQLVGEGLALTVLGLLIVIDVSIPPDYAILTSLFGLAPLIACAVAPAWGTAVIAVLALAAAVASGIWNDTLGTPQHDVRLLNVALVGAAAVAIAAVRVHREHRFAEVSHIAQVAQRAILPALPARAGHVAIAALYQSAAQGALVGGDLYDCYHSKDQVRLIVGDVRGKGIGGVEQAARVIRAFRQSAALRPTLTEVAIEMDDYLAGFFGEEEFVTALLVDVTWPGELRLVSAGHPAPQLVGPDDAALLDLPHGLPLGLGLGLGQGPDRYVETVVRWQPGDRLLMYTDGLSEARDVAGEFFPVPSLVPRLRSGPVETAIDEVVASVATYVPRGRLEDDLALVLIENLPEMATP